MKKSYQFPFDCTVEKIIDNLEGRDWNVPGITIDFWDVEIKGTKTPQIKFIKGRDFSLDFAWRSNCRQVGKIIIPRKQLDVYSDESGPNLYIYVGENWNLDREWFMDRNCWKRQSKLRRQPKRYLQYSGECHCGSARGMRHTHTGQRPPLLAPNNDLGREYGRERDEPRIFNTSSVMEEFNKYLEGVLKRIKAYPLSDPAKDLNEGYKNELKGKSIGLSLNSCISDICKGYVSIGTVKKIITGTRCKNRKAWKKLISRYKETYWEKFPDEAEELLTQLRKDGRIKQPRLTQNLHFPLIGTQGMDCWVIDESGVLWNDQCLRI